MLPAQRPSARSRRTPFLPGWLALALLLGAMPALAWAPETRISMVDEAVRLLPASLRLALESHREPLMRGALGPLTSEDGPTHRPPWSEGTLDHQVELEAAALAELLAGTAEFDAIALQFGRLAHYVADAGFPPAMSEGDGASRYEHFSAFCASRRERFPLVFYGHADVDDADFSAWSLSLMRRARDEDRELARIYAAAGDPPDPAAFDDRSVPFAVGSLGYSHSVTDIVRAWLAVWRRAGGDISRTPYTKTTPD